MSINTITLRVTTDRGTTEMTERFDEDCSWSAIAYTFSKFLAAMGYPLDSEGVGADVAAYLKSAPSEEDAW